MSQAGKPNRIDAEASDWFARLDRGGLDADEAAAFERWLAADIRHRGAYARLCAIRAAVADTAQGAQAPPAPAPSRRRLLWGGGIAAGIGAAGVMGVGWFGAAGTAYATGLGEVRIVPLDDGSSIVLNTQSRVRVWQSGDRRRAELEAGEAIFNIVDRADHPFEITAGAMHVTSRGGSIAMRRHTSAGAVTVLAREGRAVLSSDGGGQRTLDQGDLARTVAGQVAVQAVAAGDMARRLAWREGMIALEGETLREAVTEFARYNSTPIIIADPALADRTVTGLFAANDPAGFARSVALSFGVRARIDTREIRLG